MSFLVPVLVGYGLTQLQGFDLVEKHMDGSAEDFSLLFQFLKDVFMFACFDVYCDNWDMMTVVLISSIHSMFSILVRWCEQ